MSLGLFWVQERSIGVDAVDIYINDNFLKFIEKAYLPLQSKGKFKKQDIYKRSLHYAAIGNCIHLLQYLLQTEPKIDTRDMHGRTPLSWAAEYCIDRADTLWLVCGKQFGGCLPGELEGDAVYRRATLGESTANYSGV